MDPIDGKYTDRANCRLFTNFRESMQLGRSTIDRSHGFFPKAMEPKSGMNIYIKNMVCDRCIMAVRTELEKLGLEPKHITLGEVTLEKEPSPGDRQLLERALVPLGFELIDDKKSRTIERTKKLIIELVHRRDNQIKIKLSDHLSGLLDQDYNQLSKLFTEVEGTTIEKYFIAQKIEKVKELLVYDELSLSEIALRLNYSSAAYLSNQFKKVTGLTPSHFKQIGSHKRTALDKV